MTEKLCGCMCCISERAALLVDEPFAMPPGWRYSCELCGNKRCPHHTDHRLACANSNAPGQTGSVFT